MEKQKNIPELRFPEFEAEWEKKILNDTCTIVGGGTPDSGKEEFWNGHIQWFTPTEIKMDYVSKSERTITELGLKKSSARLLPDGTILLTSRATIGEVAIALNECTTNQGFQSIIVNKSYNNLFIFNWIKNNRYQFVRRANGSTFLEISKSEIGKIPICAPTLPEQQKIAFFFTAIDQKILQLKQKKTLLEQYKKGVMQKIFSQQIRFKDDNGQKYPKWVKTKFHDIYTFRNTNSFSRENLNYKNGDVKNIHYGDIHTKFNTLFDITKEEIPYVNEDLPIYKISVDNYCKAGDLVFADASEDLTDVGKSIELVNLNNEMVLSGLHTILARPNLSKITIGFGGYLMKSDDIRKQIMHEAQGSKVSSISASKLSCIQLNIPVPEEQTKIANFLSSIDDKINYTQKQIEKAEVWKKGLMQQMFV